MGERILTTDIPREEGYLYYCGTDKKGNIFIGKAAMHHGGKKTKKSKSSSKNKKRK